jgi:hypothetical protein
MKKPKKPSFRRVQKEAIKESIGISPKIMSVMSEMPAKFGVCGKRSFLN